MKIALTIITVIVACSLAGCYEMKQDEQGRAIKLNKITGAVTVLEGGKVVKMTNQDAWHERNTAKKLAEPITWPDTSLSIIDASAKLITKWVDGNLYYQFTINKDARHNKHHVNGFVINLYDNSGFLIDETTVNISDMARIYKPDNKTVEFLESKGQKEMSLENYEKIEQWDASWLTPQ